MRSQCVNSTSGHKSVTENGFTDINVLYHVSFYHLTLFCVYFGVFFSLHKATCSFDHTAISGLKSDITIQCTHFPMKMWSFQVRDTIFGVYCDDNVCTCVVRTLILLLVQICHRKWIQQPGFPIKCKSFVCKPMLRGTLSKLVKNHQ